MLIFVKVRNTNVSGVGIDNETKNAISEQCSSDLSGWAVYMSVGPLGFGTGSAKNTVTGTNMDMEMSSILQFSIAKQAMAKVLNE